MRFSYSAIFARRSLRRVSSRGVGGWNYRQAAKLMALVEIDIVGGLLVDRSHNY